MHIEIALLFMGFLSSYYFDFHALSKIFFIGFSMSSIKLTIIMKFFRDHPKLSLSHFKFIRNTIIPFLMIEIYMSASLILMEIFCVVAFYLLILSFVLQIIHHIPKFDLERKVESIKKYFIFSIMIIVIFLSIKCLILNFIRERQFVIGFSYAINKNLTLTTSSHFVYRNLSKIKNLLSNIEEKKIIQIVDEGLTGENYGLYNSIELFNSYSGPKFDFSLSPFNCTDLATVLINSLFKIIDPVFIIIFNNVNYFWPKYYSIELILNLISNDINELYNNQKILLFIHNTDLIQGTTLRDLILIFMNSPINFQLLGVGGLSTSYKMQLGGMNVLILPLASKIRGDGRKYLQTYFNESQEEIIQRLYYIFKDNIPKYDKILKYFHPEQITFDFIDHLYKNKLPEVAMDFEKSNLHFERIAGFYLNNGTSYDQEVKYSYKIHKLIHLISNCNRKALIAPFNDPSLHEDIISIIYEILNNKINYPILNLYFSDNLFLLEFASNMHEYYADVKLGIERQSLELLKETITRIKNKLNTSHNHNASKVNQNENKTQITKMNLNGNSYNAFKNELNEVPYNTLKNNYLKNNQIENASNLKENITKNPEFLNEEGSHKLENEKDDGFYYNMYEKEYIELLCNNTEEYELDFDEKYEESLLLDCLFSN